MESRNAMERIIKCIPVFMVLVFGFVIRCELFHSDLDSVFASYPAIRCNLEGNEFPSFYSQAYVTNANGTTRGKAALYTTWSKCDTKHVSDNVIYGVTY